MRYTLQECVKKNGKSGKPFVILVTENERDFRLAEYQNTQSFHHVKRETKGDVTIVTLWDYQ